MITMLRRFEKSSTPMIFKLNRFVDSQRLSEVLLKPFDLFKPGNADSYMLGLINQVNFYEILFIDQVFSLMCITVLSKM